MKSKNYNMYNPLLAEFYDETDGRSPFFTINAYKDCNKSINFVGYVIDTTTIEIDTLDYYFEKYGEMEK